VTYGTLVHYSTYESGHSFDHLHDDNGNVRFGDAPPKLNDDEEEVDNAPDFLDVMPFATTTRFA